MSLVLLLHVYGVSLFNVVTYPQIGLFTHKDREFNSSIKEQESQDIVKKNFIKQFKSYGTNDLSLHWQVEDFVSSNEIIHLGLRIDVVLS